MAKVHPWLEITRNKLWHDRWNIMNDNILKFLIGKPHRLKAWASILVGNNWFTRVLKQNSSAYEKYE